MNVENIISDSGNSIPNQFVIYDEQTNRRTFQSYSSEIITLDYNNSIVYVGEDWNYSITTGKYRNIFFRDYAPNDLYYLKDRKELEKALKDGEYNGWKVIRL